VRQKEKKTATFSVHIFAKMLADFQNSFTDALCGQLAIDSNVYWIHCVLLRKVKGFLFGFDCMIM